MAGSNGNYSVKSLLLDRTQWDLTKDALGNIAVAANPYAVSQNVATVARTFRAECWYDKTLGLPYWERILGKAPPIGFLKAQYTAAARTVRDVDTARVFLSGYDANRVLSGQIQITTTSGVTTTLTFGGPNREGTGVSDYNLNVVVDAFGNAVRGKQR